MLLSLECHKNSTDNKNFCPSSKIRKLPQKQVNIVIYANYFKPLNKVEPLFFPQAGTSNRLTEFKDIILSLFKVKKFA